MTNIDSLKSREVRRSSNPPFTAFRIAAALLVALAACSPAAAQTPATWTNNNSGFWSEANSWSILGVPDGNFNVTIDDGDAAVTVTLDSSRSVNALSLGANDTLSVAADTNSITFTSTNGFSSPGTIILTSSSAGTARLTLNNGALTLAPSGLLRFDVGQGGRRFDGDLINNGVVQINKDTTFDKFTGSYANSGQFSVTGGATFSIVSSGVFNQNAGTFDLDGTLDTGGHVFNHNGGTLDFGASALIQNSTFNYLDGTIVGTPILKNTTFALGAGTGAASFFMNDSNILASNVNVGQLITVEATSSSVTLSSTNGFTNAGTIFLNGTSAGTARLTVNNGALTIAPSGLLRFSSGMGARRMDADLINNGLVQINNHVTLDRFLGSYTNNASLSVSNGLTLTVASAGTLNQNGGTLDLDGTLDIAGSTFNHNGGTFDFGANALIVNGTYNYLGGTILGTPILKGTTFALGPGTGAASFFMNDSNTLASNVNAGQTVTVEATASSVALSSTNGFTNSGNLILTGTSAGTARLTVNNGALTVAPSGLLRFSSGMGARRMDADLINNGIVQINNQVTFDKFLGSYTNNASLSVSNGLTLTVASNGTLNQNGGTLDLDGTLDIAGSTFNHNGGTFDFGTSALIVNGTYNYLGGTIVGTPVLRNTTFAFGPLSGPASYFMNDSNTLASNINAGQTVTVEATAGSVTLASTNGFTNNGTILLTSTSAGTARLTVNNGALTNSLTGLIHFQAGQGPRNFDGDLINNGTVQFSKNTTFDKFLGNYTNNKTLNVPSGVTFTVASAGTLNQDGGTLDLDGTLDIAGSTFNHNGGTFDFGANALILNGTYNYLGGTIIGTPVLRNVTFSFGPLSGPASYFMNDNNHLASDINAGQTVTVEATTSSITLSSTNGFTNNGSILLTSTSAGTSRLSVNNGTITNGPTGLIHFQAGQGPRNFDGDLLNNGTVLVSKDTTFDKFMHTFSNNGLLRVASGATLSMISAGTLTNYSSNSLNGGTFDIAGTFRFQGGAAVTTNHAEVILRGPGSQIVDDATGTDIFNPLSTNGVSGKFRILDGRNFITAAPFTNHGLLEVGNNSVFRASPITNSATGEIRGVGTVDGHVTSSGLVAPGSSPGTLTITASYTQNPTGTLAIELADTLNYDRLVTTQISLAGTLNVTLSGGFLPKTLDSFDILDWNIKDGTFGTENLPLQNDRIFWNTSQLYIDGRISVDATYYAGDFNRDSQVTAADISFMLKALTDLNTYATTNLLNPAQLLLVGDVNNSGTVTNQDIQSLLNLLANTGNGSIAAVPEPATFLLACCAAPAFLLCRRKRAGSRK